MTIGTLTKTQRCPTCGMTVVPGNHVCAVTRTINAAGAGGPPPPPAAPGAVNVGAARMARERAAKLRLGYWGRVHSLWQALRTDPDVLPFRYELADFARKWDAVRNAWEDKGGARMPIDPDQIMLADLARMQPHERVATAIDPFWLDMLIMVDVDTPVGRMTDPVEGGFTWLSNLTKPYVTYGYGFRCDTRPPQQTLEQGFKRRWTMNISTDPDLKGTIVERAVMGYGMRPKLFMWKGNRDAVSENNICVSRTLRGCTKYPKAEFQGDAYVYVLKLPRDLLGYDTEAWQATLNRTALWQPGEKAFLELPAATVIASLKIQKQPPSGAGESHRFTLPPESWTWYGGDAADRNRISAELDALRRMGDQQTVMLRDDFRVN